MFRPTGPTSGTIIYKHLRENTNVQYLGRD